MLRDAPLSSLSQQLTAFDGQRLDFVEHRPSHQLLFEVRLDQPLEEVSRLWQIPGGLLFPQPAVESRLAMRGNAGQCLARTKLHRIVEIGTKGKFQQSK